MPRSHYRIMSKPNAVRLARITRGFDPPQLASLAGISRSMISTLENGGGVSMKTAHKVSRVLGQGFSELFDVIPVEKLESLESVR